MIFPQTKLIIADNSGCKIAQCIGILGQKKVASIGRVITVAIKSIKSGLANNGSKSSGAGSGSGSSAMVSSGVSGVSGGSKVRPGEVHKALIIRTKKSNMRKDGRLVRFDDNAAILLNADLESPLGSRIYGPVGQELRSLGKWDKVLSLATKIL